MSWLTPLGFLGAISIIVLILIYILKPNFQKRIISSTYIWKLSLRYRKRKVPINRFRNLLIFLCQVLILTSCTLIIAQPVIKADIPALRAEKIAIIDASAGMQTKYDDETRFERAVGMVRELASDVFEENGLLTVIVADDEPHFIAQRADSTTKNEVYADIEALATPEAQAGAYSVANVEGAMNLAENILNENPECEVLYYTGTSYIDKGFVTVVDVTEVGEWNAAILDCRAVLQDNIYTFFIDVAQYGRDGSLQVNCDVYNINGTNEKVAFNIPPQYCSNDETQTIEINPFKDEARYPTRISSFSYIKVTINEDDSFAQDNSFYVYGGEKQKLRIQYDSGTPNSFFGAALMDLRDTLSGRWNIEIKEIRGEDENGEPIEPEFVGFDMYIFEHEIPEILPTDGVVIIVNPDRLPGILGLNLAGQAPGGKLSLADPHPISSYVDATRLSQTILNQHMRILPSAEYETVLYCGVDPVFMVKNTPQQKVAVLSFSLNYSDLPVLIDFPILMYNMFEYFLPSTITSYAYNVDDTITLNARGETLTLKGPNVETKFETLPATIKLKVPGIYELKQKPLSNRDVTEYFFVRIAATESNIFRQEDELPNPVVAAKSPPIDFDLLIYFASALVALLFLEWLLQSKDA